LKTDAESFIRENINFHYKAYAFPSRKLLKDLIDCLLEINLVQGGEVWILFEANECIWVRRQLEKKFNTSFFKFARSNDRKSLGSLCQHGLDLIGLRSNK